MRVAVPLGQSYKLINHGPTTLIAAAYAGQGEALAGCQPHDGPSTLLMLGRGEATPLRASTRR